MGNHPTRAKVKSMAQEYKIDIIAITEPMIKDSEIILLGAYLEMPGTFSNGNKAYKLGILW